MSKSSKKKQGSSDTEKSASDSGNAGQDSSRTYVIVGGVIVVLAILIGFWMLSQGYIFASDPIVGTWADQNNYWGYAYYGNGSYLEMSWYTHKTGDTVTHVPVYMSGQWKNLGNNTYSIIPDGANNTTYTTVINDKVMSVLNMDSNNPTHKISKIPDVGQVTFNYAP